YRGVAFGWVPLFYPPPRAHPTVGCVPNPPRTCDGRRGDPGAGRRGRCRDGAGTRSGVVPRRPASTPAEAGMEAPAAHGPQGDLRGPDPGVPPRLVLARLSMARLRGPVPRLRRADGGAPRAVLDRFLQPPAAPPGAARAVESSLRHDHRTGAG